MTVVPLICSTRTSVKCGLFFSGVFQIFAAGIFCFKIPSSADIVFAAVNRKIKLPISLETMPVILSKAISWPHALGLSRLVCTSRGGGGGGHSHIWAI